MARREMTRSARERVLDAAVGLFCEHGYKGTTTREVARRARVNEVTVFRLFGTKEGLFLAVIQRETDIRDRLEGFDLRPTGDMVADLTMVALAMHENMTSRAPLLKLIMTEAAHRPALWSRACQAPLGILSKLEGYFTEAREGGLLRAGVDPRIAAVAFFSFFFRSLIATAFLGRDVFIDMDRGTIEGFVRMFLDGTRKEAHT